MYSLTIHLLLIVVVKLSSAYAKYDLCEHPSLKCAVAKQFGLDLALIPLLFFLLLIMAALAQRFKT